jgi:uncharacterized protein YqfB (UPF0267 family)
MKNKQKASTKELMIDINDKLAQNNFVARIYPDQELASLGIIIPDIFSFEILVQKDAEKHNVSVENKSLKQICKEIYPPDIDEEIEMLFSKPEGN